MDPVVNTRQFMHYDPGNIDLEQTTLQTTDDPLGAKL